MNGIHVFVEDIKKSASHAGKPLRYVSKIDARKHLAFNRAFKLDKDFFLLYIYILNIFKQGPLYVELREQLMLIFLQRFQVSENVAKIK